MKPFIICDIGSNHRGQLDLALKSVEAAKECGADAVKFQLFTGKELYGLDIEMPTPFQADWLPKLADLSRKVGIGFMCSAFSPEGVAIIDPHVERHKLASSEFCHVGIIDAMIATGKPIIASTGGHGQADVAGFLGNFHHDKYHSGMLTLMECVALYPAPPEHYNLNWVRYIPGWIGRGISDHTLSNSVAVAAVGAGATVFEKHLDPFPGTETPDSCVSIFPTEFKMYVQDIREAASAMGDGIKQPRHQHMAQTHWKRRLIVTQRLAPGDVLRYSENYGIYRSLKSDTKGLPPWDYSRVNGRRVVTALEPGDSVGPRDLEE